jgi:hypothetical protein
MSRLLDPVRENRLSRRGRDLLSRLRPKRGRETSIELRRGVRLPPRRGFGAGPLPLRRRTARHVSDGRGLTPRRDPRRAPTSGCLSGTLRDETPPRRVDASVGSRRTRFIPVGASRSWPLTHSSRSLAAISSLEMRPISGSKGSPRVAATRSMKPRPRGPT